jgi:hypothetical protein
MAPEILEPALPASKRRKTYALSSAATEVGTEKSYQELSSYGNFPLTTPITKGASVKR